MAIHKTEYKTENGKTRKVKEDGQRKVAPSNSGAAGSAPGADGKPKTSGNTGN